VALLYDRHTPRLYGLALRLSGGDVAGAEDVVHDVWIRAVERLGNFRWESSLGTWLGGFVINGFRDRSRAERREVVTVEEHHPADDMVLLKTADRLDLERAIAGLPPGFRQVLILHDVEGYTHEEIAALLDIVPGTSKSQLARARDAVRRALGLKES
jgi:RNA polymerase sigma-70 factor (ECF subfamily)